MEEDNKKYLIVKGKKIKKIYLILIIAVFSILIIDQVTKIIAINSGETNVIDGVFKIAVSENTSGAYGVGSNSTFMYIITNLVVIAVLFKFITSQNDFISTKIQVFSSLIIAGGLSNVMDRIFRGYVIEFFDFKQLINIPAFNIADISIIIGWICFIAIFSKFSVEEIRKKGGKTKENSEKINDKENKKI